MKSTDKIAFDLFQKLRARYTPVTLGSESAEATSDPKEARFFNFVYKEQDQPLGPITVSLLDNTMKVFYGEDMVDDIAEKANWYNFLRELRGFAKRNLLTFDARDVSKSQLDSRDFKWLSNAHGKVDQKDVSAEAKVVKESAMFGSKRRSYQTLESVKLIVQHSKTVDESVPGARSRSIQGIYLERSDGERYKFPYNYLTGARAMARHITEGGTPYDPIGQHVLSMIKEMRDLSKFARMTKAHAAEDAQACGIRDRVVERYQTLKGTLGSMCLPENYKSYVEAFVPNGETKTGNIEDLRERFTRRVWDTTMEELLPSVQRALETTADKSNKESLQFEGWADDVINGTEDLEDIAQKIIDSMSLQADMSVTDVYAMVQDYLNDADTDTIDRVAQIIIDRLGIVENVAEATTTGTIGTSGTSGTRGTAPDVPPGVDRAKLAQGAKNITRLAQQGAGIKTNSGQMGKLVQAMVTGQALPRGGAQTMLGLGNQLISNAMQDPQKANQLTAMLRRMRQNEDVSTEFDNWCEANIVNENVNVNDVELDSILKLAGLDKS